MASLYDSYGFPVLEKGDDVNSDLPISEQQVEHQRPKWAAFIKTRGGISSEKEPWLWKYWKTGSRTTSQITKKFLGMVGSLGIPSNRAAQRDLKKLIRKGIPPELRSQVWYACSGAAEKKNETPPELGYQNLVKIFNEVSTEDTKDPKSIIAEQIRRDLHRTFPMNIKINTSEGMEKLRRILGAYSIRNPQVGYCQSMNFIVGILLLYMEEENAFWTFTGIIEDILPNNYYSEKLVGCRVDQQVFSSCISWKLPDIGKLLDNTETILEPVTCSWFMSCFANILPHRVVFRLWDCLLWEGNIALIRAGIALLRAKSQRLKLCDDSMSIYMELRDISPHIEVIMGGLNRSLSSTLHVDEHHISPDADDSNSGMVTPSPMKSLSMLMGNTSGASCELAFINMSFNKKICGSFPRRKINELRVGFLDLMVQHDESRNSVVKKRSIVAPPRPSSDHNMPHPPADSTILHPPTGSYSPTPPPLVPSLHTISSQYSTTTSTSSSLEASLGVENMKINVDTTRNDEEDRKRVDGEDEYEFVHEGNYLRSMLDADTPIETMATYAASKSKLHGVDEVFSKIMSSGGGDSDDEED